MRGTSPSPRPCPSRGRSCGTHACDVASEPHSTCAQTHRPAQNFGLDILGPKHALSNNSTRHIALYALLLLLCAAASAPLPLRTWLGVRCFSSFWNSLSVRKSGKRPLRLDCWSPPSSWAACCKGCPGCIVPLLVGTSWSKLVNGWVPVSGLAHNVYTQTNCKQTCS